MGSASREQTTQAKQHVELIPRDAWTAHLSDDQEDDVKEHLLDVDGGADTPGEPKIRVRGLRRRLEAGGEEILGGVDLDVPRGVVMGIIGPSGGGKSTLLRALNRLWEPAPGTVFLDGADICGLDVLALRRKVGMLFQQPAMFDGQFIRCYYCAMASLANVTLLNYSWQTPSDKQPVMVKEALNKLIPASKEKKIDEKNDRLNTRGLLRRKNMGSFPSNSIKKKLRDTCVAVPFYAKMKQTSRGCFDQSFCMLTPGTVADNVRYGPLLRGKKLTEAEVKDLLILADLDPALSSRPANELSVGQAQRVALARTLANNPEVLLLDEPTSALDPISTQNIEDTITRLKNTRGLTTVIVSHSVKQIQRIADLVCLVVAGKVVEVLVPSELSKAVHPIARLFLELS
ncbi:hypothetical protein EJB05_41140, partial [Eragrostis curvula]